MVPLELASNLAFAIQDKVSLRNGVEAPQLYYPLPSDTKLLRERKSKRLYFRNLDELAKASTYKRSRNKEPDALTYLHVCTNNFVDLGRLAISKSPVPPSAIFFTDDDIIGSMTTTTNR